MTYAVILAGGVGSRFWPFSRELEPKQFMKIVGEESLLQSTIKRVEGVVLQKNIFIVTNSIYFYEVLNQIKGFKIPEQNIILEPEGKNTAPAVGLCARLILKKDKDAVLLVLPADHYIKDNLKFRQVINKAVECARKDLLNVKSVLHI
jgi:mannose-1-phosphate guanylyltransferase